MNDKAIETIFDAACQLDAGEKRNAYLDLACEGDTNLRRKLDEMLDADERANAFFDGAAPDLDTQLGLNTGGNVETNEVSEGPGTIIGRYKLLQKVGEGGMGVVYMAEQTKPVTRKVALKIIKLGMDTKQVVARFEAERQALAMMDHPNIAKVLDAGSTETGRPYFVMELVRGVPITEYCDKNKLSTQQRLDLFLPVCQAIQHAHHKGVIHRDIKPSNVMVTLNDGVPHPMVIDFGIAKAVNQKLTEKTLFTNYAQMIGTPAYMSPEQAEMSKLDVDTRTDVYSLGVLLYELLTGTTPFPAKELLSLGYGEMQRIISEQEPPKPSTRYSTMENEERTVVAKNRSMEVSALSGLFQGDLDWIVMKALEKDRTHRYETVNGLASDIQRHLNNEPVTAVAPTFGYQLRKFARRNRKYARLAATVSALLLIAMVIATWQAVRATSAMQSELAARKDAEKRREEALQQQAAAEAAQAREHDALNQAVLNADEARANELRAKRLLYAFEMQDVHRAIARDDRAQALKLLEKHIPKEGEPNVRNWEWRYLWKQLRGTQSSVLASFSSSIHSLSVSHDGRYLAVGRSTWIATNALAVIDLKTQQRVIGTPNAAQGRVRVAFSPVESLLAFNRQRDADNVGDDVLLWDFETRSIVARFSIDGTCAGIHFSADGRTLFAGSSEKGKDSQIVVWDVGAKAKVRSMPAPNLAGDLGTSETFSVDRHGDYAALTTNFAGERRVKVFDLNSGKELWSTGPTQSETIIAVALSPDGKLLATCDGWGSKPPVLWDAMTGERLAEFTGHREHAKEFVFWPDGRTLATAGNDQTIYIWDISNPRQPKLQRKLFGNVRSVWQLALSPDGRNLYSGAQGGIVLSWDPSVDPDSTSNTALDLDIMPGAWFFEDGGHSFVALKPDGRVVRRSGESFDREEVLFQVAPNLTPYAAFSINGRFLGVGHYDGRAAVWDVKSGRMLHDRKIGTQPSGIANTRNDGTLLLGVLYANTRFVISDWDLSQSTPRWSHKFKYGTIPFGAESPDGNWMLRPHDGKNKRGAWLMNRQNGNSGVQVDGVGVAHWATFSSDSRYFAIDGPFQTAAVYETATLTRVTPISDNLPQAQAGAFSPDDKRFATVGRESTGLNLYDFETGQVVFSDLETGRSFIDVQFSSDGNLISAQSKGELHIWRAPSWEEIRTVGEKDRLPELANDY